MLCIYFLSPDKGQAVALIQAIAFPMVFVNALGTGIFLSIILGTLSQEESMKAIQTHDVLELANTTLPYFRQGLTSESAEKAAKDFGQVEESMGSIALVIVGVIVTVVVPIFSNLLL